MLTMQGNRLGATLRRDAPFGSNPLACARTLVGHLAPDEAATMFPATLTPMPAWT